MPNTESATENLPLIKYTQIMEIENKGSIPFLSTLIRRSGDKFTGNQQTQASYIFRAT